MITITNAATTIEFRGGNIPFVFSKDDIIISRDQYGNVVVDSEGNR